MELRQEQPDDWWEVEALYDLCFAPGREMLSSYRLRDGIDPVSELCMVARDDQSVLGGAIRFWPVRVGAAPCLLLGPVAVHPTRQGEGLGAFLIQEGLQTAAALGWERVLLVGDAPYYSRFGFYKAQEVQMPAPTNPDRVLAHALRPHAWDGVTGQVRPAI
ncbi:MAG: N-acetyltransferase [Pseudomonadota bacterium]